MHVINVGGNVHGPIAMPQQPQDSVPTARLGHFGTVRAALEQASWRDADADTGDL